ncbi:MAG: hypothetical protein ABGY41_01235 [Candidatus Poribacteria bacterium]
MSRRTAWITVALRAGFALVLVASLASMAGCSDDDDGLDDLLDDIGDGGGSAGAIMALEVLATSPGPYLVGVPVILTAVPLDEDGEPITTGDATLLAFATGVTWTTSDAAVADVTLVIASSTIAATAIPASAAM